MTSENIVHQYVPTGTEIRLAGFSSLIPRGTIRKLAIGQQWVIAGYEHGGVQHGKREPVLYLANPEELRHLEMRADPPDLRGYSSPWLPVKSRKLSMQDLRYLTVDIVKPGPRADKSAFEMHAINRDVLKFHDGWDFECRAFKVELAVVIKKIVTAQIHGVDNKESAQPYVFFADFPEGKYRAAPSQEERPLPPKLFHMSVRGGVDGPTG